jgi:osmotically-inducible protein OsmY
MKTDSELKKDLLQALAGDQPVPVPVPEAQHGAATTPAVEHLNRGLKGGAGSTNNNKSILLQALLHPTSLSVRIQDALIRQAMREAKRIEISVDGSVVTLRGHIHSWAENHAAEGVTWSAPGVSRVINELTVLEP